MSLRERLPDRARLRAACAVAARRAMPGAITVGAIAAAALAAFLGYRWLTGSERFALAGVDVRGVQQLTEDDVARAVRPSFGQNVFQLSLDSIEQRLRAEPWVADVSVKRQLPDHLVVEIDEHRAVAVVDLDGLYLADASGRVFKRADLSRGEARGLPVVTGVSRDLYRRTAGEAEELIRAALSAATTYAAVAGRPALGEVHRDPDHGLTLYTRKPVVAIHVGRPARPGELDRRLALFDAAWAALSRAERAALSAIHLDRDGAPVRVTVAFADPR
jgi:cell division septal protein FtsQ